MERERSNLGRKSTDFDKMLDAREKDNVLIQTKRALSSSDIAHNKALLRKIYSLALLNFRRARRYTSTRIETWQNF